MNFLQFYLIILARIKLVFIVLFLVVGTTLVVTLLLPKSYTATTSILLNYKGMDPVTGMALPAQLMPGYMATQVDIIQSQNVARKVVEKLGLDKSPQAISLYKESKEDNQDIQSWLAVLLLKKLDVKPSRESSLVEVQFSGVDPNFAATVANAFAETYIATSVQLKTEPALKAANYFSDQLKALRQNLEDAQNKLSKYQQDNQITSIDDRLDVETTRLNEMSTQLSMAEAQAIDSTSRKFNVNKNAADSPDVAQNPIIQNLRLDLSRADSKLSELSNRLSENHPQYVAAKAEVDKIKAQLKEELTRASNNIIGTASINQQRVSELRAQLADQKKRVLELNRLRSEFTLLQKDVLNSQAAIDAVNMRLSQTKIEGQSDQSDISVLNPASPPSEPSSPKMLLNIILSIFLGGLLGVGYALLVEMLNRKIRTLDDLTDLAEIPVLAVINTSNINGKLKKSFLPFSS